MTIVEFLLARIAEDEEIARRGLDVPHETSPSEENDDAGPCPNHCVGHYSGRRHLAECQAKRAIVELYDIQRSRRAAYRSPRSREIEDEQAALDRRMQEARTRPIEAAVRQLAAVYADHPDYDTTWRVT